MFSGYEKPVPANDFLWEKLEDLTLQLYKDYHGEIKEITLSEHLFNRIRAEFIDSGRVAHKFISIEEYEKFMNEKAFTCYFSVGPIQIKREERGL